MGRHKDFVIRVRRQVRVRLRQAIYRVEVAHHNVGM